MKFDNSMAGGAVGAALRIALRGAARCASKRTLFLMLKLMKLVSRRTRYGGPRAVLYRKKRLVGAWSLRASAKHTTVVRCW